MYALHEGFESRALTLAEPPETSPRAPIMGEAAVPDVPAAVGRMFLAACGAIMAAFLIFFTRSTEAAMMVVISALYGMIYFTVPVIFLNTENRPSGLSLNSFLANGLDTWTGHVDGRAAIIQILSVPVTVAVAVTAIGILSRIAMG